MANTNLNDLGVFLNTDIGLWLVVAATSLVMDRFFSSISKKNDEEEMERVRDMRKYGLTVVGGFGAAVLIKQLFM